MSPLTFLIPYLGALVTMAVSWQVTVRVDALMWLFMAVGIVALAAGFSLLVIKRTWIGMGVLAGVLSYVMLMPFLPPY